MTCFTDNPLERLMRQKPLFGKRKDNADDVGNHNDTWPKQPALSPLEAVPELAAKLRLPGHKS
jgi:hypothetical protein